MRIGDGGQSGEKREREGRRERERGGGRGEKEEMMRRSAGNVYECHERVET